MSETQQPEDESVGVDSDVGSGFRKSLGAIVIVAVMSAGIWFALTSPDRLLSGSDEPVTPPSPQRVTPPSAPTLAFVDRATEAGVDFVHDSGARGAKLLPECLSGGVSVADLNADGKPDLVFAQGQPLDDEPTDASNAKGGIVVYRNASNANGLAFVRDASPDFGDAGLYANGFALGDVNADGKPDLYVTAVGQAQLLMNESVKGGAIAFTNRTGKAGLSNEPTWSTAAGFFDPDADGDLDLLELHYVQWSPAVDEAVGFTLDGTHRAYGPPTGFGGTLARFYLNNGNDANGTPQFVNQSAASGVEIFNASTKTPAAKSLGLVFADINHDFKVDVLIANDRVRKFALFNRSTPSEGVLFEDGAAANGFAFDRDGIATGAMGIDVAHAMPKDIGTLAVAIGNFAQEPSALYLLPALSASMTDASLTEGVGAPSRPFLTFGTVFADLDLDGREELIQANGHLEPTIAELQVGQTYAQRAQVFWNTGGEGSAPAFSELSPEKTGALAVPAVGRALAAADLDGDGDIDLVLTALGGAPRVLEQIGTPASREQSSLVVALDAGAMPGLAAGAVVEIVCSGSVQRRIVSPTRSYLTAQEPVAMFGLGGAKSVDSIRVRWSDGTSTEVGATPVGRVVVSATPKRSP